MNKHILLTEINVAIYALITDSFFSPLGVNSSYAILEKLSLARRTPLYGRGTWTLVASETCH